jgi:hypothetical protein
MLLCSWHQVADHLSGELGLSNATKRAVKQIWDSRRRMLDSPLHGAGYCLDPEFLSDEGLAIGNDRDACIKDLLAVIDKLIPDVDSRDKARASYASFRAKEGVLGSEAAQRDASSWPAHQWWEVYGVGHPKLQRLAVRVLSQVTSACSCERNWSTYDFIHSKKRNKLKPQRARDLVYAFTNIRLVESMQDAAGEQFVGWDEEEEDEDEEQQEAEAEDE